MSEVIFLRGICVLILSATLAYIVLSRDETERLQAGGAQRYVGYGSGILLPAYVASLAVCEILRAGIRRAAQMALGDWFGMFLHICLYYLLLLPLLPLLRRRISARACAMLWLLPNYLYITQMTYMQLPWPRFVVEIPSAGAVRALSVLWLAGFWGVLGWNTGAHLVFRARILGPAAPVTDPAVLAVWEREVEAARFRRPRFRLVTSPAVRTPLSVGLFRRSLRVVLPERYYTEEELALLFRHELIHIGRGDTWSKFFMVFCTAMCWFNPLMWVAMKKSAEDLELSCDETVLLDCDGGAKRRYAGLLLRTAGDEQGFTTCLSASARSLRYRLKSVTEPERKHSGAVTVGLAFFLLCMSCGHVALAYGEETGAERIYRSRSAEEYSLCGLYWIRGNDTTLLCTGEAALHRRLAALRTELIAGNYSFDTEGRELGVQLETPEGRLYLTLSDRFIELLPLYGEAAGTCYLPGGMDWEALEECILECPHLFVRMSGTDEITEAYGESVVFPVEISVSPHRVSRVDETRPEVLYTAEEKKSRSGITGFRVREASLRFALPMEGDCTAEVTPLRGEGPYAVTLHGAAPALPAPDGPARYRVWGRFRGGDGALYQAEYRFYIGPES